MLVDDLQAGMLQSELRWLAAELGKVRNLDVLMASTDGALRDELTAARAKTFGHVRAELASARTRILMIDLTEWLAMGDWRTRPTYPDPAKQDVLPFARALLKERRARLKRRGAGLADLPDARRHKVRIEAKKLRYGSEFFASLFPKKKARKRRKDFLKAMEELQDHLGELNDMVVGPQTVEENRIGEKLPPPGKNEHRRLLDRAEDAYDILIDAETFWG
jgi:triphosphatase